ncbi:hypothetical protein LWI29_024357 [Acer saccharum]|uniref:Uncharacterized protein n=1 Tax=Acer saccharum TaxID=4024 RepID=A0AA39RRB0_ACESA|nr:hypothetical protein LWI29_024357 [Acer saccharum]
MFSLKPLISLSLQQMVASLESQLLIFNPILTAKSSHSKTPLHVHSLIFKLPNFPTKNPALLFSLNSSSSSTTTTLAVLQLLLRHQTPTTTQTRLPSLMSLRTGPGTAAKLSELPGKSLSGGLALGGPRPKLTYSNALKRWWCSVEGRWHSNGSSCCQ